MTLHPTPAPGCQTSPCLSDPHCPSSTSSSVLDPHPSLLSAGTLWPVPLWSLLKTIPWAPPAYFHAPSFLLPPSALSHVAFALSLPLPLNWNVPGHSESLAPCLSHSLPSPSGWFHLLLRLQILPQNRFLKYLHLQSIDLLPTMYTWVANKAFKLCMSKFVRNFLVPSLYNKEMGTWKFGSLPKSTWLGNGKAGV